MTGEETNFRTNCKRALSNLAYRVDLGFSFEVRIEPPQKPEDAPEEVQAAIKTIRDASANLQFMKLEGPPILALPASTEADTGQRPKNKPKKPHKDEEKK
jgi:hypothetical protein